jgi:hypothetical protein
MGRPASAAPTLAALIFSIIFSLLGALTGYAETAFVGSPSQTVITIKSVELKDCAGRWVLVIEPDKQVDLEKEEPGLSFFNNGRVSEGSYVNFRLKLLDPSTREISARQDFQKPLEVRRGSFISVWFSLDKKDLRFIEGLELTAGEDTRKLSTGDLAVP